MTCGKKQFMSYVCGRSHSSILFCSSLFVLLTSIKIFRILNIKEFLEIHLYTFWVEKLVPDISFIYRPMSKDILFAMPA